MTYWERADVESFTETQTATGNIRYSWSELISDVEARVLPLDHTETDQDWALPEEEAYEIQLRGSLDVHVRDRITIDSRPYDVRRVRVPPPFGTPTTIAYVVLVTP